jgi:hypothetical protein
VIYQAVTPDVPLSQGDIIDRCPILVWDEAAGGMSFDPAELELRVVVLTQACDLAQTRASRVLIAVVHSAEDLVNRGILKAKTITDQIRSHRVYGWYFLPAGAIAESIVDLRDLHTVPRRLLERLIGEGNRLCRMGTPYREHLAQHLATTYSRIGLPEPYETQS